MIYLLHILEMNPILSSVQWPSGTVISIPIGSTSRPFICMFSSLNTASISFLENWWGGLGQSMSLPDFSSPI